LAEVKRHVGPGRTILGSGDLFTAHDCLEMMRRTGVDGVTVARGAIGNPWIFTQARALAAGEALPPPPTLFVQREVLAEHFRLAVELYGESRAASQMRKFGIKYAAAHPQHLQVREAFTRVRGASDWQAVLDEWYADDLPGCYPDPAIHRGADCEEAA
jgi:tRNA-dihydrouridine synthase